MGINLTAPGSASPTAALFYDTGALGATSQMTKVNGVPVSAAVEIQSTTGALLVPRMTTAQRNALVTVVDGMEVYDTTVGAFFYRQSGVWAQSLVVPQGIQYAAGTLTRAQLLTLFSVPVQLLAAPGAGFMYVVNAFRLEIVFGSAAFVGGGDVTLQYGVASNPGATFDASEDIAVALMTTIAANQSSFANGYIASATTAQSGNAPLAITCAAADFTVGTGCSGIWQVWYSIVPVV